MTILSTYQLPLGRHGLVGKGWRCLDQRQGIRCQTNQASAQHITTTGSKFPLCFCLDHQHLACHTAHRCKGCVQGQVRYSISNF